MILSLPLALLVWVSLNAFTVVHAAACGGGALCACGDTVTTNHTLACGIDPVTVAACPGDGLVVSSGVTLDLGGCTLAGSGSGIGVTLQPRGSSMTVVHGYITHFAIGVTNQPGGVEAAVSRIVVARLQLHRNTHAGVLLDEAMQSTIEQNAALSNGREGFEIAGGRNLIRLNRAERNAGAGFSIRNQPGMSPNTITQNIAHRNGGEGFTVRDFGNRDNPVTVTSNRSEYNQGDGFVFDGDDFLIARNVASSNRSAAIPNGFVVRTMNSRLESNGSHHNSGSGIVDHTVGMGTGGTMNEYVRNVCRGNALGTSAPPGLCR
jgi:hypothetical protein